MEGKFFAGFVIGALPTATDFSTTSGADLTLNQTITTAGTYYVVTLPDSTLPTLVGVGTTLPMWGTQSYTLSVTTSP